MKHPVALVIAAALIAGAVVFAVIRLAPTTSRAGQESSDHPAISPGGLQQPAQGVSTLQAQELDRSDPSQGERAIAGASPGSEVSPLAGAFDASSESEEVLGWRKKHGEFSHSELSSRQGDLRALLATLSAPAFDEYRMRGQYDVVAVGQTYSPETWDNSQLTQVRVPAKGSDDQRVLKIVIRESDYPDLLAMHREALWLDTRLKELLEMRPTSIYAK